MSQVQYREHWYPTKNQIEKPDQLEITLRRILTQHYDLQDRLDRTDAAMAKAAKGSTPAEPAGGPANTRICGLLVQPIDTATLSNGATLKFNKASGNFIIS